MKQRSSYSYWSQEEIDRLLALREANTNAFGRVNWGKVAAELGERTALMCKSFFHNVLKGNCCKKEAQAKREAAPKQQASMLDAILSCHLASLEPKAEEEGRDVPKTVAEGLSGTEDLRERQQLLEAVWACYKNLLGIGPSPQAPSQGAFGLSQGELGQQFGAVLERLEGEFELAALFGQLQ